MHIALDPWSGGGNMFRLPPDLILFLNNRNIKVIAQVANLENSAIFEEAWLSVVHLGIPDQWQQDWEGYVTALTKSHVRIK